MSTYRVYKFFLISIDKTVFLVYYRISTVVQYIKGGIFVSWKLDKTRPICPQICEQICVRIASGEFKPNERLMSVREVAVTAGVNPNTVQKSFEQLDAKGIIYSVRGSGWFVSAETVTAKDEVDQLVRSKTADYFDQMNALGMDNSEIKQYVKEWNTNE